MSAVIIDWLGRGGIAQTTPAWVNALRGAGHETIIVTRGGRELADASVVSPREAVHPLVTHRRLATLAASVVRDTDPDVVVVQNYVVPPLELALDRALHDSRARSIVVMHDHRLHSPLAGTRAGLRRRLRAADVIVTHSQFVARAVEKFSGATNVVSVPLPLPPALAAARSGRSVLPETTELTALLFGVVRRHYKGVDVLQALGAAGVDGWRFAAVGVGAPTDDTGVIGVPGFIPAPDLVATIAESRAVVVPYRNASQSATVVLAQALGAVPVATAVGGIPEQITDGVDGFLIPPGAPLDAWRDAFASLADAGPMRSAAAARVRAGDRQFRELAHGLA